jgi:hypothetical protein
MGIKENIRWRAVKETMGLQFYSPDTIRGVDFLLNHSQRGWNFESEIRYRYISLSQGSNPTQYNKESNPSARRVPGSSSSFYYMRLKDKYKLLWIGNYSK